MLCFIVLLFDPVVVSGKLFGHVMLLAISGNKVISENLNGFLYLTAINKVVPKNKQGNVTAKIWTRPISIELPSHPHGAWV